MDESVRLALAKWPNVPHCYGWLGLDARGAFRMRDDAAQAANLPGEVIRHPALLAFIFRNYACDERGAWYFQNGPQRVYVELEATPFIARTDPALGFVTHDGEAMGKIGKAFMTDDGRLLLQSGHKLAMLDDRDLAECLPRLTLDGKACDDAALLSWLTSASVSAQRLALMIGDESVAIERIPKTPLEQRFHFIAHPSRLTDTG
jgi:hypothetical protein